MANQTSSTPILMSATSDDQATGPSEFQSDSSVSVYPNVLINYASYSPIISLLATTTANYNKMVNATGNQKYIPSDWYVICKSGGIGQSNANFVGGSSFFQSDMYIDSMSMNTIVGMSQDNRGSNATDIEMTIIEPYGMDFIEQLYDFCNITLGESNYCQIPYMLKIEFKGFKDDGTNETVPNATKFIPIHLASMGIKVTNGGAIYKVGAFAYNELGTTEQYGRIPTTIQLGSLTALAKLNTTAAGAAFIDANQGTTNPETQSLVNDQAQSFVANNAAGISNALQGQGNMADITSSFAGVLNNIQQNLFKDGVIGIPDVYTISYSPISSSNNGYLDQALFIDLKTMQQTKTPVTTKDTPMGPTILNQDKSVNLPAYARHVNLFTVDLTTGTTESGVTYGNQLITFNSGSSIIDCLNTLFINSNYIVVQISRYNNLVDSINQQAKALNLTATSTIPASLQEQLDQLQNTTLDWFHITPKVTILGYDTKRSVYARSINYIIEPYKIYNVRSISAPNGNPIADNRVVKEYDYIFTGKNTEILTFDLNFNNAFYTYSQFNHDTKGQATGAGLPADNGVVSSPASQLSTKSSPITNGQYKQFVSSSTKSPSGIGAQTPERNQAADVAATIYAVGEQIELDLTIYGDPDYIRQDGIFVSNNTANAYILASDDNPTQGIVFNSGEVYANVNFKIPQDVNLNTGLLNLAFEQGTANYRRNVFSGQYRVLTVANKFDKALFTQQVHMIRFEDSHNYGIATQQPTQNTSQNNQNAQFAAAQQIALDSQESITPSLPPLPPTNNDFFGVPPLHP
jgi:hypothetical protein